MKEFLIFTIVMLSIGISSTNAQTEKPAMPEKFDIASFGVGLGLDNGGIGGQLLVYPSKNIGLFGGVGYAVAGAGYNVGVKYRFHTGNEFKKFTPFLTAMYGYNAAVNVTNVSGLNKFFYGPTIGVGGDVKGWPEKKGYWSFALLIPIRDDEVSEYIDYLESHYGASFGIGLLPVGISAGYHFIIGWK